MNFFAFKTTMELFSANTILLLLMAMNFSLLHASAAGLSGNVTDRQALLEFKSRISEDPYGVLNSWNDSQHHCQWQGVKCGKRHQRVTTLSLGGKSLLGSISPRIGNLSFMMFIDFSENRFYGEIPKEAGRFTRLKYLNMSTNSISGEIPVNLSQCQELKVISLFQNQLVGTIPPQLGSLKKLAILYLHKNNLTGEIPHFFGNLSSLILLSLEFNNLEGNLPKELVGFSKLQGLAIGVNQLSGVIPREVYNNSELAIFSVSYNMFQGTIPADIGVTLPNLQMLEFYGNQFTGTIPASITNLSKLRVLEVGQNNLYGQVPSGLGNLPNLERFNIEINLLGSNSPGDLNFISSLTNCSNLQILGFGMNNFGGQLPHVIGNLSSQLMRVHMNQNHISGPIPVGFGKLVNLINLNLQQNSFTGGIPSDFLELQNLQQLGLGQNFLSGQIPSNFCNITSLYVLNLSTNGFQGEISQSLKNCKYLQQLDISQNNTTGFIIPQTFAMLSSPSLVFMNLSQNSFSGSLPLEVGKLINLNAFDVSYNKLSGQIPATLVDCWGLEYLYMEGNLFQGTIPPNFASLKVIQEIDLSCNNLTGQVPRELQNLKFLQYLNLSFNDLEGEIPTAVVFANASQIILVGNRKLCGGIPQLGLPPCLVKRKEQGHHSVIIITSVVAAAFLISIAIILCLIIHPKRDKQQGPSNSPSEVGTALRISYHDLYGATEGFSSANLIGSGSFGIVYKGRLNQHGSRLVAVKVLDIRNNMASKSFKAECRALRNIRHRNLVPLLTYCSSIDAKGHEFKALVYKFMENGNLDIWLHPKTSGTMRSRNLNLLQRLNIAIDIASALDYLHNDSEVAVAHCDLKPSNILLDHDLTAHVGDFGLARLLQKQDENSAQHGTASSSTIAIKGSIGYAAPEYAMGMKVSTLGDVYSFGILLLEMFTGRRPTDDAFTDGLDLHHYVEMSIPEQVLKIVDLSLLGREAEQLQGERHAAAEDEEIVDGNESIGDLLGETRTKLAECLVSVFKIGLGCSERSPGDRMDMEEVTRALQHIRDDASCIC